MIAYFLLAIALAFSAVVSAQETAGLDAREHEAIGAAIPQTLHPNSSGWSVKSTVRVWQLQKKE